MPQVQKRIVTLEMPAEEYPGFTFEFWVNCPAKLWNAVMGGDPAEISAALCQMVMSHNEWLDFDGEKYPPANTPEFWQEIPTEMASTMMVLMREAMRDLPNSAARRRRS